MKSFLAIARAQGKVDRVDSRLEAMLAQQLRAAHAPAWTRNHLAIPGRKLEIDFAWPAVRFAVEVQGEVHRIREHFHRDVEKSALLQLEGWQLLPVDGRTIRSGQALVWVLRLLRTRAPHLFAAATETT
jgi:very-short-patch-repair endonuclease